ncbi:hypothetical protein LJK87_01170 [Paenibacillus sp. P25]|nr:hypothetical protein LJK87_01170 [Paenibacillus sp. P25]
MDEWDDGVEITKGTDPKNPDTDNDGIEDSKEEALPKGRDLCEARTGEEKCGKKSPCARQKSGSQEVRRTEVEHTSRPSGANDQPVRPIAERIRMTAWRSSSRVHAHMVMPKEWFSELGLCSLADLYNRRRLQRG